MNVPYTNKKRRARIVVWLMLAIWLGVSLYWGNQLAQDRKFRINDVDSIAGAGTIQRDFDGTFYHVRNDGKARAVYRILDDGTVEIDPPVYGEPCYDCRLVSGEQLSAINDFCVTGKPDSLPRLDFEAPCETWATINNGPRVMAALVFFAPLLLIALLYWVVTGLFRRG